MDVLGQVGGGDGWYSGVCRDRCSGDVDVMGVLGQVGGGDACGSRVSGIFATATEPKKAEGRGGVLRPSHIFSRFSGIFILGITFLTTTKQFDILYILYIQEDQMKFEVGDHFYKYNEDKKVYD